MAVRNDLPLAQDKDIGEMARWISDLAAERKALRDKLEERQGLKVLNQDPDWEDFG
jgi:hypothetical protein